MVAGQYRRPFADPSSPMAEGLALISFPSGLSAPPEITLTPGDLFDASYNLREITHLLRRVMGSKRSSMSRKNHQI